MSKEGVCGYEEVEALLSWEMFTEGMRHQILWIDR